MKHMYANPRSAMLTCDSNMTLFIEETGANQKARLESQPAEYPVLRTYFPAILRTSLYSLVDVFVN